MLEQTPKSPKAPPRSPKSEDPKVTQLYLAIKNGDDAVADRLIAEGVDFSVPSDEEFEIEIIGKKIDCIKETALTLALKLGKKSQAHKMIVLCKEPKKLNSVNGLKETALIVAAKNGHRDTVALLLEAGADKEATNEDRDTALILAASKGHIDVVALLLEARANIEARNKNENTALMVAAANGHTDIVDALIKAGANIEAKGKKDNTALIIAAINGRKDIVASLIKAGANIEAKDKNGDTALLFAAWKGHTATVDALLKAHADIEAKTKNGDTALIIAAWKGHTDTVDALIKAGANIEAKNKNGDTALNIAAGHGHTNIVASLIKAGANIEAKNKSGSNALNIAAGHGHTNIVASLLKAGANIEAVDEKGNTALIVAAAKGHKDTVAVLLGAGANLEALGQHGQTALILAILKNHTAVVELLLKAKGINSADKDGNTELMLAARKKVFLAVLKFLMEERANLNLRNREGDTAFSIAFKQGNAGAAQALYESGADIFIGVVEHEHQADYIAKILKFHPLEKLAGLMCSEHNSETSVKLFLTYAAEHGRADLIGEVIKRYRDIPDNIANVLKDRKLLAEVVNCIMEDKVNAKNYNFDVLKAIAKIDDGKSKFITGLINGNILFIENQAKQAERVAEFFNKNYKKPGDCSFGISSQQTWKNSSRGSRIVKTFLVAWANNKELGIFNADHFAGLSQEEIFTELLRNAVMSESGNEFFAQLVRQGANPNIRTKDSQTLLDFVLGRIAFFKGFKGDKTGTFKQEELKFKDVFRAFMLSRLTDINLGSLNGQTPLHTAVVTQQVKEIALLILRGADASAIDNKGKKPADYIRQLKEGEEEPAAIDSEMRTLLGMSREQVLENTTLMKDILGEYSVDDVCVILEASGIAAAEVTKHRGILTALKAEIDKAPVLVPPAKEGAGLDDDGDIEMSSTPAIGSGKDERPGSGMAAGVITQSPLSPSSTSSSTSLSSTSSNSSQAATSRTVVVQSKKRKVDDVEPTPDAAQQIEPGKAARTGSSSSPAVNPR